MEFLCTFLHPAPGALGRNPFKCTLMDGITKCKKRLNDLYRIVLHSAGITALSFHCSVFSLPCSMVRL